MTQQRAATNSVQPFIFQSLGEVFSAPVETIPYLVDGLLPSSGLSVLAGKPKAGKSTLARQLAFAVGQGQSFLGMSAVLGTVLYFAIEEKLAEIARHFRQLGANPADPIRILCGALQKNEAIARLEGALQSEANVQLVIIDPMFRFLNIKDSNDYIQVSNAMEKLLDLARRYNVHILTVHHMKKKETEETADGTLGSIAINGGADTIICLKTNGEGVRSICTRQRYGTDLPETQLDWDAELRTLSLGKTAEEIDAEKNEKNSKRIESEILTFVEQNPSCSQAEVFEAVAGNASLKKQVFRELVEAGVLVQSRTGHKGDPFRYVIVTQAESKGSATNEPVSA